MLYEYNKNKFRKRVVAHFNQHLVEYQSHLTSKMFDLGFAFIEGFVSCLKVVGEEPIDTNEVDELIFKELVLFLTGEIDAQR